MNAESKPQACANALTGVNAWLTVKRFALVLAVLIAAAFPEVISAQRTFVFGDYGLFGHPLAYYHRQNFWSGEIPLWNPLNNCGLPFLAQWNTLVCYPLSLSYLVSPLPWSLGFYCLFHLFLAGLGMYCLARSWTANQLAAAVAGIAFSFNGLTLHCLMWPNNIAALGWMPWVVCLVEQAWRKGGRTIALAAIVGATQMLTGAPEVILFTWAMILVMGLETWLRGSPSRNAIQQRFLYVAALTAGLASVQLLPFLDLLAHSHRDTGAANTESAMPLTGWGNYLVPLFRCYKSPPGIFYQPGQFWASSYYLSLGVLACALSAAWIVRERRTWLLAGLAGTSLILTLGDQAYLYAWARRVFPPFNLINFPIKFVVLVAFCVPLLAAVTIREYHAATGQKKASDARAMSFVSILMVGFLFAVLWFAHTHPKVYEQWPTMWKNGVARAVLFALAATLFYACERIRRRLLQLLFGLCLLTVIWWDGVSHVPRQNPTAPPSVYKPGSTASTQMNPPPRHGESRAMLSFSALEKFRTALLPDPAQTYLGHRLGLYFNCNLLEGIPKVDGFYSLYFTEQLEALFALYAPTNGIAPALADFMGVSQISSPTNMLEWMGRQTYLPMITAGQKPIFADDAAVVSSLVDPRFNPREIVYLSSEAKPFITAANPTRVRILTKSLNPGQIEMQIEAEQPSLVVVAQTFYYPWRAYVDGLRTPLRRANLSFQALEVPAGKHAVRLSYEDVVFRLGAVISWLVLIVCCAVYFWPNGSHH